MTKKLYEEIFVEIPDGVNINILDDGSIEVKGKLGTLKRDFGRTPIKIEKVDNKIRFHVFRPRKKELALLGTLAAHLNNMITGVTKGFTYYSRIVYAHFPIKVSVKGNEIIVEKLYGGLKPLKVKILGKDTKVKVQEEDVIISGIDKEAVAQTAANLQEICRLRGKRHKSPRTFMDGIYIYKKEVGLA